MPVVNWIWIIGYVFAQVLLLPLYLVTGMFWFWHTMTGKPMGANRGRIPAH